MNTEKLLALLRPEAEKIDTVMRTDLEAVKDPQLSEVLSYALFNGGKRVRPLLCVLAAKLCGLNDKEVYRLAVAYEYLHVATLLHDDVIDHSDTRRGRPTVSTTWDTISAILAGDYLHARSMYLVGNLGGRPCLDIICRVTTLMVEGEFLQMRNAHNFNQSEQDYFQVIHHKTAAFIAAACETGAVFAKAEPKHRQTLADYGAHLGYAFQIVDDLLDYHGDPEKTGKSGGNDFIEGKMTLPLIHCLAKADDDERTGILALLQGEKESRLKAFAQVRTLIERHGGFSYARLRAEQNIQIALDGLSIFNNGSKPVADILAGLCHYVLVREK